MVSATLSSRSNLLPKDDSSLSALIRPETRSRPATEERSWGNSCQQLADRFKLLEDAVKSPGVPNDLSSLYSDLVRNRLLEHMLSLAKNMDLLANESATLKGPRTLVDEAKYDLEQVTKLQFSRDLAKLTSELPAALGEAATQATKLFGELYSELGQMRAWLKENAIRLADNHAASAARQQQSALNRSGDLLVQARLEDRHAGIMREANRIFPPSEDGGMLIQRGDLQITCRRTHAGYQLSAGTPERRERWSPRIGWPTPMVTRGGAKVTFIIAKNDPSSLHNNAELALKKAHEVTALVSRYSDAELAKLFTRDEKAINQDAAIFKELKSILLS